MVLDGFGVVLRCFGVVWGVLGWQDFQSCSFAESGGNYCSSVARNRKSCLLAPQM